MEKICRICKKPSDGIVRGLCRKHYKRNWRKEEKKRNAKFTAARYEHVVAILPEDLLDNWISFSDIANYLPDEKRTHLSLILNTAIKAGASIKKRIVDGKTLYRISQEVRKPEVRCSVCGKWADFPILKICRHCYNEKHSANTREQRRNHSIERVKEIIESLPDGYLDKWHLARNIVKASNLPLTTRGVGRLFNIGISHGMNIEKSKTGNGTYYRKVINN